MCGVCGTHTRDVTEFLAPTGSSCSTEVTFNRLVQVIRASTARRRSPTCGAADHVHRPLGVAGGDQLGQLSGVRDLSGLPGPPQPRSS